MNPTRVVAPNVPKQLGPSYFWYVLMYRVRIINKGDSVERTFETPEAPYLDTLSKVITLTDKEGKQATFNFDSITAIYSDPIEWEARTINDTPVDLEQIPLCSNCNVYMATVITDRNTLKCAICHKEEGNG